MPSLLNRLLGRTPATRPDPTALIERGNALEDAGDLLAARALYEQALAQAPEHPRALLNLGNALLALGRADEAVSSYRRVLAVDAEHFGAHLNLGNALLASGRGPEAVAAYRAAARLRPDSAPAWTGLGCALEAAGAPDEALQAYRSALAADPGFAGALLNLFDLLVARRLGAEARALLESAVARNPGDLALARRLAFAQRDAGESEAAVAGLRRILAAQPDDLETHSDLLFATTLLPWSDVDAALAEHRRFGERLAARVERLTPRNPKSPSRALKIGFVSPDLRRHPVAVFIEPVLRHLDRASFEAHCYFTGKRPDDISDRLAALCDRWQHVAALDDAALARKVMDDGIDLLFDLAGHTAGRRLGVFARKPAPVQLTWLGYLATTGVAAIDYRLCDRHTDPPGRAEAWQVEAPLRAPDSQWCYAPLVEVPAPGPLPRSSNGYWTFVSANQIAKLNRRCLAAWAKVMAAVPDSRLRILGVGDPSIGQRLLAELSAHGVASTRVDLIERLPMQEYLRSYAAADILLDTFPYNGATTSCDALLMGVPVATVAGDWSIARGGVSLLSTLGLQDWIAASEDALPELVRRHTADVEAMAALRAALPSRLRASPLMGGARFTRNLEALLREAWRRWCAQP
jgi:predicted O-linked N-acetylglucosamine transferase (SPINDLY family)